MISRYGILPRRMDDPAPPYQLIPPIPEQILAWPFAVRLALWMAYGSALGIPVDSIVQVINTLMAAAKRQLSGKRLRMTIVERLSIAKHALTIPMACRDLFQWIVSPESMIR